MGKTDKTASRLQQVKRYRIVRGGLVPIHANYFLGRALLLKISPKGDLHFYPPDARHRGDDNLSGAFKHGRGGIAQSIRHDNKTWLPTTHFHPHTGLTASLW